MEPDLILRSDGWYWFDDDGRLVGPYETRAEAAYAWRHECEVDFYDPVFR